MSVPTLEITEPGILTTVQDRGRYGYQRFGVPPSGAFDQFALRAANLLVGNPQGAAGLEMTVIGPTATLLIDTWIAVTGADLAAQLNGQPMPRWESVEASAGSVIAFPEMRDGVRAYLAVAGGIDVPPVMGSRSTYVQAGIGGFQGRALSNGDVISTFPVDEALAVHRELPEGYEPPRYGERHEVRVILGPQLGAFGEDAISTLTGSEYLISLDSDRMGYRLEGPRLEHEAGADVISDGNPLGAIQVPGDGTPTVLLVDRGTTGGYTKIATVISSDISQLAQAVPGQSVTFRLVTHEEARRITGERETALRAVAGLPPRLSVKVDGEVYEVVDDDGEVVSEPGMSGDGGSAGTHRARATLDGRSYEFEVEVRRDA